MRFDEALSLLFDLAEQRLEAHRAPGGMLAGQLKMLLRADRTADAIKSPLLAMRPETATPRSARLSGALSVDRDVPLSLVAQVSDHDPGRAYMACVRLASRAQEALLVDPETGEEDATLWLPGEGSPGGSPGPAFSLVVGDLVMPAPVRGASDLLQARGVVMAAVEADL